jgi:hypothetical protein
MEVAMRPFLTQCPTNLKGRVDRFAVRSSLRRPKNRMQRLFERVFPQALTCPREADRASACCQQGDTAQVDDGAGIWTSRRERKRRLHQPRGRPDCPGEMVQVDGSHHRWFENRGPKCDLLAIIEDPLSNRARCHLLPAAGFCSVVDRQGSCQFEFRLVTRIGDSFVENRRPIPSALAHSGRFRLLQNKLLQLSSGRNEFALDGSC